MSARPDSWKILRRKERVVKSVIRGTRQTCFGVSGTSIDRKFVPPLEHKFCKKFMPQGRSNKLNQPRGFERPISARSAEVGGYALRRLSTGVHHACVGGGGGYIL